MRPILGNATMLHRNDACRMTDGGKPVGDDNHRPAFADCAHIHLNRLLAFQIKGAGGLVEYQDTRVNRERARDRDALALTTRKTCAALSHLGVVPSGYPQWRRGERIPARLDPGPAGNRA